MSSFLLVALAIAATPHAVGAAGSNYTSISAIDSSAETNAAKDPRTPAAWRSDIRAALRRESSTKGGEREAAVQQLLTLYQQLGRQTNLVDTEQRQLRAQIRSRLQRTSESLAIQARRRGSPSKSMAHDVGANVPDTMAANSPVHIELPEVILAQQIGAPGVVVFPPAQQGAANPFGQPANGPLANVALLGPDQSAALAELIRTVIAPDRWDPNGGGAILAQQLGPPAQAAGFGAQNAGIAQRQNADAGLELVELIQQTIAPDSWDVNGGPGTIMYFSPLRVLVVRQTDEVHDALGGVIQGLRN